MIGSNFHIFNPETNCFSKLVLFEENNYDCHVWCQKPDRGV